MKVGVLLIVFFLAAMASHAQTKLECDSIVDIALTNTSIVDTTMYKANLKTLNSIEKRSSMRRIRSRKKLDGIRRYVAILEQREAIQSSCSTTNNYSPLTFDLVSRIIQTQLDSINEKDLTSDSGQGKSKAAKAQNAIAEKNSAFQRNQIILLKNQQKILIDTQNKTTEFLCSLVIDQRIALEKENRNRWLSEKNACREKLEENKRKLILEIVNLKKVYARAYRRYLHKPKKNK